MKSNVKVALTIVLAVVALIVILVLVFALDARNFETNRRVALRENVRWSSADPEISFTVFSDTLGGFGTIRADGVRKDVYFSWGAGNDFEIENVGEFGFDYSDTESFLESGASVSDSGNPSDVPEVTAGGTFERKDDDTVVLTFSYDHMFSGALAGVKVTLTAEKVDPETVGARDRSGVLWENTGASSVPVIRFFVGAFERRRGTGEIERDGWRLSIRFYFREDGKFEIFSFAGYRESDAPILSGTYAEDGDRLILNVTADEVYGGAYPSIALSVGGGAG